VGAVIFSYVTDYITRKTNGRVWNDARSASRGQISYGLCRRQDSRIRVLVKWMSSCRRWRPVKVFGDGGAPAWHRVVGDCVRGHDRLPSRSMMWIHSGRSLRTAIAEQPCGLGDQLCGAYQVDKADPRQTSPLPSIRWRARRAEAVKIYAVVGLYFTDFIFMVRNASIVKRMGPIVGVYGLSKWAVSRLCGVMPER